MRFLILILVLLTACGRPGDSESFRGPVSYSLPTAVQELERTYRQLAPGTQDQWGFIDSDKCDSLLFTSLLGASGVEIRDLFAAEDPENPGRWERRPAFRAGAPAPCFIPPDTDNGSKSSISRDMLLGLMWYGWAKKDLALLERLYQYADEHGGVMGYGDPARTGLRTLRGTLAAEIHALGGPERPFAEIMTDPNLITNDGYAAHLQVLHILLRGEIYGELSSSSIRTLQTLADRHPNVPIMQAAAARWVAEKYSDKFLISISHPRLFPRDRLPTSQDRCINWVSNETNPLDLIPCIHDSGKVVTHSGGDLLFAIWIYSGSPR